MENKSSQSSLLIGIVVVLLIAAVTGDMLYRSVFGETERAPTAPEVSVEAGQSPEPAPQAVPEPDADTPQSDALEATEPDAAPSDEADSEQESSATSSDQPEEGLDPETSITLQTVRVDSDGAVVIAGRGVPAQLVEILINGEVFETVLADGQGNFVSLFDLPYSEAVRVLSLRSIVDGQELLSDQDAIIAPAQIAAAAPSDAQTEPENTPEPAVAETEIAQADEPSQTESQPDDSGAVASDAPEEQESNLSKVETETDTASTNAQSDAQPAVDSGEDTIDTQQAAAEESTQSEQDTTEAPVIAAADANGTTDSTTVAQDSKTTSVATDENAVVSSSEQSAEPKVESEAEIVAATDVGADQDQTVQNLPAGEALGEELAAVSTKDSTQEPTLQESASQEPASQKTETAEQIATAASSADAEQPADSDTSVSADANTDKAEPAATDSAEPTQTADTDAASKDAADGVDATPEAQTDQTPTVMIADQDGVRVVQSSEDQSSSDVALDAISYDEKGEVALSGRGTPEAQVLVYLDNAPISSTVLDSAGQWKTDLTDVDPGVYTLRIDQLDTGGKVVSRLETPFQRENRERLIEQVAASAEPARVNVITVQPGYTLWAIARSRYGRGILYVQVFEANRDKIGNPDLIYPGQVFQLPD
ncbi:MAG: LysM peptidoglycan-binding domain-containing protein [Marinovum sp.]|nr:LysM peptidoglycan-binding domain-containing protein [Marinovum sp.]